MKKILVILLIALIPFFLASCQTTSNSGDVVLPSPVEPAAELQVVFEDAPDSGGLLLKYDEYRKLETNIINMRGYIDKLELQNKWLREKLSGDE